MSIKELISDLTCYTGYASQTFDNPRQRAASEALIRIGTPAVEPLMEELAEQNLMHYFYGEAINITALIITLGKIGDEMALPLLGCIYEWSCGVPLSGGYPPLVPYRVRGETKTLRLKTAPYDPELRAKHYEELTRITAEAMFSIAPELEEKFAEASRKVSEMLDTQLGWWGRLKRRFGR